jgi:hypothetical protein
MGVIIGLDVSLSKTAVCVDPHPNFRKRVMSPLNFRSGPTRVVADPMTERHRRLASRRCP